MKPRSILRLAWLSAALPLSGLAQGTFAENYSFSGGGLPLAPADGTGAPASDTRIVSGSAIARITDLDVHFTLTNPTQGGAYNGDYYVSLQHDSGFSVLLNRAGRGEGSGPTQLFGYGDNGFSVTFDDQAGAGDIHIYRTTPGTPVDFSYTLPLTGTWAPDGRTSSPLNVVSSDPRDGALLNSFNGLDANGTWTLQIVDFSPGGTATLNNWGLAVKGVPEPSEIQLLALTGAALLGLASRRRWRV